MRLHEILRIALCDMLARRSSAATFAIITTVVALTSVTVGAYGLVLGQRQVNYHRIRSDPLASCLWVGEPEITKRKIDWPRMRSLDQQVRDRLGNQPGFDGCFPFRLVELEFYTAKGNGKPTLCVGRTYVESDSEHGHDPILSSLGVNNVDPAKPGIILTPIMLKKLSWSEPSLGDSIQARSDRAFVELSVAGVAKVDLPYGLDFLIPEGLEDTKIRLPKAQLATGVVSGKVPPQWSEAIPEMLAGTNQAAESWKLLKQEKTRAQYDSDTRQLVLTTSDSRGRDGEFWSNALDLIAKQLPKVSNEAELEFLKLEMTDIVESSQPEDAVQRYDMAGFYFSDLSFLQVAETVVQQDEILKGYVDTSVIKQLSAADAQTKTALRIVSTFEVMIAIMALTNLLVVQWFRAVWQRREAGMLRACGMRSEQLMLIALFQGTVAWLIGNSLGLAIGWIFGRSMAALQYKDPDENLLGFLCSPWLCVVASGLAWLLCCGASFICSLRSYIVEPAQLVDDI